MRKVLEVAGIGATLLTCTALAGYGTVHFQELADAQTELFKGPVAIERPHLEARSDSSTVPQNYEAATVISSVGFLLGAFATAYVALEALEELDKDAR